jgi:hypothetical protein
MQKFFTIAVVGVGVIVTAWGGEVSALPARVSPADDNVTLSGNSLRGLEVRNADKDFSSFFSEGSPNLQSDNDVLVQPGTSGSLPLRNLEFRGGTVSGNNSDPFRYQSGDSDQQFRVQYRVPE